MVMARQLLWLVCGQETDMTLYHVLLDDGTEAWLPQPLPEVGPSVPAIWQDVSSSIMFGFNGLRHWPD